MDRTWKGACLALAWASSAAWADEGRIVGLYYEGAPGVLLERAPDPRERRWAEVQLADGRRIFLRVPTGVQAREGDGVDVQLAARGRPVAPLAATRIVAVTPRASEARARLLQELDLLGGARTP